MLYDNYGRAINYLRLAVTDRCNLRCFYCMPEEGIEWLSRKDLMSHDEMLRICSLLINKGVDKIRITGGEPFLRKDLMPFLTGLSKINGLKQLSITTNGVLTAPHIPELKRLGIRSVNLSLDTLSRERFFSITRRDDFPKVMETLAQLLHHDMEVKINAVVMQGRNTDDIIPLAALTKDLPVTVRFIEEMPFNGGSHTPVIAWDHIAILEKIKQQYPDIQKIPDPPYSTAYNYHIPGHKGGVGIIAAYTRLFCGTCNRIRITPQGVLKNCLYDDGVLNIKDMLRNGSTDEAVINTLINAINHRPADGWEAERERAEQGDIHESMATIGG